MICYNVLDILHVNFYEIAKGIPPKSMLNTCIGKGVIRLNENQNLNQDYTRFGGWLLVWYWGLIVGGALVLLSMVLPALLSIVASFFVGIIYAVGVLISIVSICASAVFYIMAALQLKGRNSQFFDTFLFGMLISLGGSIISSLLMIRSVSGVGRFIFSTIGSVIGVALSLCLCIMYFSKSVRVNTFFGGRPLQSSRVWDWIKILPDFIISDTMPSPHRK